MADVTLRQIRKDYGGVDIIHGLDLHIKSGEFVVFVGPSGCGKSTLLRMVAGLETISAGDMHIGETRVNDLAPRDRDIAMVFQDYALYPHKTVRDNMGFGLRLRKFSSAEIESRVNNAAETLQISHLLDRFPKALSGGQRQRVAMGRAIVRQPKVFLFDEPLSNLDALLRNQVRAEIKKLHRRVRETVIYVTHDQVEAMTLADRIVVLQAGRIVQVGTPDEIYGRPQHRFVAGFTGSPPMNFLPARLAQDGDAVTLHIANAKPLVLPSSLAQRWRSHVGCEVEFGIRPENLSLSRQQGEWPTIEAEVELVELLGAENLLTLKLGAHELKARLAPEVRPPIGARLAIALDPSHFHLFDLQSGNVIQP
ncbi:MAG: sn-glycerol-3-phosphate ABC transporter ATP-binding protein UgpC [Rhodoferax sp.]|nr:sn-glycerol-3-phosphate ABC transporter ATP-binding protein UgpC [Rhodoferax sp.]